MNTSGSKTTTQPIGDAPSSQPSQSRTQRHRHYIMTTPTFFTVTYSINPWMDANTPVTLERAITQWQNLRTIYENLGHTVDLIEPIAGLPDMVYTANAGLIINNTAIVARFKHPERAKEADAYASWMRHHGHHPITTHHYNEGQGDLLIAGNTILAGYGFRTDLDAHTEIATITGMPLVSLELIDPHFYHLDTALTVLDEHTIAYYPPAFAEHSRTQLQQLFPDAIEVSTLDAHVLGLNAVSDGKYVVHPYPATNFADQLTRAGFHPVGVDLSELLKGGGSVKCCTWEIYP